MRRINRHEAGVRRFLSVPILYWNLIWQLGKREIVGRYQGSMFGLAWSFFNPLLMLLVYTLFFTEALGLHAVTSGSSKTSFANSLFVGLIAHGFFAECASRGPRLVTGNPSYVKKIVFPLEVLPWVSVISAAFHALISLAVLLLFVLLTNGAIPYTFLLVIPVLLPLGVLCLAVGWFLASLGVYLRDVGQIVGVVTTAMMFTAPVFFPINRFEGTGFAYLVKANPLTFIINEARNVALWGRLPDFSGLLIYLAVSTLLAWLAYAWFQKVRGGFSDVL
jgi:lipopolysaccharide transport system permease protein